MSKSHQNRSYYPALDGLRGIGCLLVVVYHNFPFIHEYLFFGWLAMDIFFVLSGFLITDILINTFGEKGFLRNFYARRMLRVFPLYYATLILFFLILPWIPGLPFRMDYFIDHQAWFWTFLQNWILIFNQPHNQNVLSHLWSMAVEEQFYLLWPLVVVAVRRPKLLLLLLITLLLCLSIFRFWLWIQQFEGLSYYNLFLFTRIDGICIGCMVALMQKIDARFIGKHLAVIVLLFAAVNFIFYAVNLQYQNRFPYLGLIGFSTFSMIFGLLVYDIINRKTKLLDQALNIEALKFIGRISYGTYIFHWPLYLLLTPFLVKWAGEHLTFVFPQLFASVTATVLAYLAGYLSYRFFELRFLRMKKYFGPKPVDGKG